MSVAEILKVLSQLDVKNDEHWTADGAPRLDVVQRMYPGVTRDLLVRVGGKFSRKNPVLRDLDKEREEARLRMEQAEQEALQARERQEAARKEMEAIEGLHQQVKDSHALTRQNQAWIASQNAVQLQRMERGRKIDELVADAGGAKNIGRHPVEVNTALRIKAQRKEQNKNFVAPKPQ